MIKIKGCVGCGACAAVCPAVFEMKNGKATVKADGDAENAINICPTNAISVE